MDEEEIEVIVSRKVLKKDPDNLAGEPSFPRILNVAQWEEPEERGDTTEEIGSEVSESVEVKSPPELSDSRIESRIPSGSSRDSGCLSDEPRSQTTSLSMPDPDDIIVRYEKGETNSDEQVVSRISFIRYSSGFVCDEAAGAIRGEHSISEADDNVFQISYGLPGEFTKTKSKDDITFCSHI